MKKSDLIAAIQKEILRHDFGTFVNNPPRCPRRAWRSGARLRYMQKAS